MQTMTAAEAKQKFGQLMDKAQRGPVAITKHGRRVGIMCSAEDYDRQQEEKEAALHQRLLIASREIESGEFEDGEAVFKRIKQHRLNR